MRISDWSSDVCSSDLLLGEPGRGFAIMMEELPRERLTIASRALGESQRAFELTVDYVKEREAFGQRIIDFQNTQFTLADIKTSLAVGWAFHDQCLATIEDATLSVEEAAMIKQIGRASCRERVCQYV